MPESASHSDQSSSNATESPALGARGDWWAEEAGLPQPDNQGDREFPDYGGTSRVEWIAHKLVKDTAPMTLSGTVLFGDPDDPLATHDANVEVELTDPEVYIAPSTLDAEGAPERFDYRAICWEQPPTATSRRSHVSVATQNGVIGW